MRVRVPRRSSALSCASWERPLQKGDPIVLSHVANRPDLEGAEGDLEAIRERANQQLGKGQRLSGLERRDELPRSTIGKILKRELRDPYWKDLEQSKRD